MLKVLLGAIRVIVRAATSASSAAIGVCWRARQQQVAVDLVRADEEIVAQAGVGHARQFIAAEGTPDRVMRIAQDEDTGPVGDGSLEGVEVNAVLSRLRAGQLHRVAFQPGVAGGGQDGWIDGRLHQHAVARGRDRAAGQVEAGDHAWHEHDVGFGHLPAVQAGQPFDDDGAQIGRFAAVAEHAV